MSPADREFFAALADVVFGNPFVEVDDLADFDGYIDGSYTLSDLRDKGIDTSVVKRAKVSIRHFKEGESEDNPRS